MGALHSPWKMAPVASPLSPLTRRATQRMHRSQNATIPLSRIPYSAPCGSRITRQRSSTENLFPCAHPSTLFAKGSDRSLGREIGPQTFQYTASPQVRREEASKGDDQPWSPCDNGRVTVHKEVIPKAVLLGDNALRLQEVDAQRSHRKPLSRKICDVRVRGLLRPADLAFLTVGDPGQEGRARQRCVRKRSQS